jgi:hypothetical protein
MPYQIGREHGLAGMPTYHHRHNGRRYDSANANDAYSRGYGEGTRQRILGASTKPDLFDMSGVSAPHVRR